MFREVQAMVRAWDVLRLGREEGCLLAPLWEPHWIDSDAPQTWMKSDLDLHVIHPQQQLPRCSS